MSSTSRKGREDWKRREGTLEVAIDVVGVSTPAWEIGKSVVPPAFKQWFCMDEV